MRLAGIVLAYALSQVTPGVLRPAASLEIRFPESHQIYWGRYFLNNATSHISGWITPRGNGEAFKIDRISASANTRFKAILYSPGCALQTAEVSLPNTEPYQYSFQCEPLPQTELHGVISSLDPYYRDIVVVEAKYVARWAPSFFGYNDGTITGIPLGTSTALDSENHFKLAIPDFSKDKLANSPGYQGELHIWLRNKQSGQLVASLSTVPGGHRGIPITALGETSHQFTLCYVRLPSRHDEFGFSIRDSHPQENACGN